MDVRCLLLASLGAVVAVVAGCHDPASDNPMSDAATPDAALDAAPDRSDGVFPDTIITSGPTGFVAPRSFVTYTFVSVPPGAAFECALLHLVAIDASGGLPYRACSSPFTHSALNGSINVIVRARDADGDVDPTPAVTRYIGENRTRVRLMAGQLTSGSLQTYEDPGTRIFQGLHPDVAMIQEFNVGDNTPATIRSWVDTTFGTSFEYFREAGAPNPNGIISRYPILASGVWEDTQSPNREFAYARIDLPGARDLWAVSVHLLNDETKRPTEAAELVAFINANLPLNDYLVIGGNFNTETRTEAAITTLGSVVKTTTGFPSDQAGDSDTDSSRTKPHDWLMFNSRLAFEEAAVRIGAANFIGGLVFDSRIYTPLADVSPVLIDDSGAVNMQHMGVVRDIVLPPP